MLSSELRRAYSETHEVGGGRRGSISSGGGQAAGPGAAGPPACGHGAARRPAREPAPGARAAQERGAALAGAQRLEARVAEQRGNLGGAPARRRGLHGMGCDRRAHAPLPGGLPRLSRATPDLAPRPCVSLLHRQGALQARLAEAEQQQADERARHAARLREVSRRCGGVAGTGGGQKPHP
jgi:hypothetical protein